MEGREMSGVWVAAAGEETFHFCCRWPVSGFFGSLLGNSDKLWSVWHSLILAIAKTDVQSQFLGQIEQF